LFSAFVAAGAISKANADDPKKSALVRCARTDKGVHAAGNVISLKLCDGESNIVEKINENLSSQIRIWGIQRTVNSFSCYQACDSRWYEYLIPTHSFLPPHPSSHFGKKLVELADEVGDRQGYDDRQEEVLKFWSETEEKYIKPILDTLDDPIKDLVQKALYYYGAGASDAAQSVSESVVEAMTVPQSTNSTHDVQSTTLKDSKNEDIGPVNVDSAIDLPSLATDANGISASEPQTDDRLQENMVDSSFAPEKDASTLEAPDLQPNDPPGERSTASLPVPNLTLEEKKSLEAAIKQLRLAYNTAKRAHRIHAARLARIQPILDMFLGTRNFHNYTVAKTFRDPSAKRIIKSFKLNPEPLIINGTEWLSLKIHGQSFMMHQIRKMVGMIALVIRCGCPTSRIAETFANVIVSIPKVPGLGLLLERPVFDSYNDGPAEKFSRPKVDFSKYEKEMEEFKQREIYERIFREEEQGNAFHTFFAHVDNFKEPQFWYLSSKGLDAVKDVDKWKGKGKATVSSTGVDSDDEESAGKEEDG